MYTYDLTFTGLWRWAAGVPVVYYVCGSRMVRFAAAVVYLCLGLSSDSDDSSPSLCLH